MIGGKTVKLGKTKINLNGDSLPPSVIAYADSLDPDQDKQNIWSDLDMNCLTF